MPVYEVKLEMSVLVETEQTSVMDWSNKISNPIRDAVSGVFPNVKIHRVSTSIAKLDTVQIVVESAKVPS